MKNLQSGTACKTGLQKICNPGLGLPSLQNRSAKNLQSGTGKFQSAKPVCKKSAIRDWGKFQSAILSLALREQSQVAPHGILTGKIFATFKTKRNEFERHFVKLVCSAPRRLAPRTHRAIWKITFARSSPEPHSEPQCLALSAI